jgi:hypothetical protein
MPTVTCVHYSKDLQPLVILRGNKSWCRDTLTRPGWPE